MEVIERVLEYKSRSDVFHLYPIGDIHAGSIHCAENDIRRVVQEIKSTKNALWIGMGDYADSITHWDKRWEQYGVASWCKRDNIVESQRKWLKELFKPIAPKCLCLLTGNHEETIHTYQDNDLTKNLCSDLEVPYGGYMAYAVLKFNRKPTAEASSNVRQYKVHAWHGSGAAQMPGARLNRLLSLVNEFTAHIYLMGHLHAMSQHTPDRIDVVNGRVKSYKLAATMTGSWLRAYTQPHKDEDMSISYPEKKGYKPSRIGCPVIHIRPDKDEFTIES